MAGSIPKFKKYPRTPHLEEVSDILGSEDLEVYEKMDGGNCQVRKHQGRVFCGNRSKFLIREGGFRQDWFGKFHKWAMSNYSLYNLPESSIVYGEFLAPHTVPYNTEFRDRFFLIDLYDLSRERFVPYVDAREMLENLGIEGILFLDPLWEGELEMDDARSLALEESQYTSHGREGIVLKDYKDQRFAKLWRTSVLPAEGGLREEVRKTLLGLQLSGDLSSGDFDYSEEGRENLVSEVYDELQRSGRDNISVSEIREILAKSLEG